MALPAPYVAPDTALAKASRSWGHPWLASGEPLEYYPLYNLSVPADERPSIRGWANPTKINPEDPVRHQRLGTRRQQL